MAKGICVVSVSYRKEGVGFFLKKWVKKRARQQASLLRGLTGFISLEDCDCLNSYNDFQSKKAILIQTS